ncbi:MAG: class I SAM-dependent methyltransferase [Phycisphaerales bacterium]
MDRQQHWQHVYETKADDQLSWFQQQPTASLALIRAIQPAPASAIDIGGGQSALAAALLREGVAHVAVLDISVAAIDRAKARLGHSADRVRWIVADVLDTQLPSVPDVGTFDLWHDRAVFHFLTNPDDRRRYAQAAARTVRAGGHAVIATFAPTGPEKCSGLPVQRYDADALAAEFAPAFTPVRAESETHTTPWGKAQDFTCVLLRRAGS